MNHNFRFDDINTALPILMGSLRQAEHFDSRAGLTKEMRHVGITLDKPWQREIVLESRKANVAAQIVETMWVLAGKNDVATLLPYLPRAADFSDNGRTWRSAYGPRLRNFNGVDQLAYVVETLKANPGSRQAVVNLWDASVDSTPGKDVACNNWLSFSSRHGTLDLHVGIRSNDAMWGWSGINAFEWSILLEIVAGLAGLEIGSLHFSTTSFHLYEQHWEKASRIASDRTGFPVVEDSPGFSGVSSVEHFDRLVRAWFTLEERVRTGLSIGEDVETFPEPMMRSWLRVLQWYWSGDAKYLDPIAGTRLDRAALVGVAPAGEPQRREACPDDPRHYRDSHNPGGAWFGVGHKKPHDPFLDAVNALHSEKHAAYGDSWKRRGERGILSNVARKIDRIGSGLDTSDETQADTAIDLLVYLAKYRCWLAGLEGGPADVEAVLSRVKPHTGPTYLAEDFALLEEAVDADYNGVPLTVNRMLEQSMALARSLWQG